VGADQIREEPSTHIDVCTRLKEVRLVNAELLQLRQMLRINLHQADVVGTCPRQVRGIDRVRIQRRFDARDGI
jgi:hypothetical protein